MAFITAWFKVLKDNEFIGVVTEQSFARYSPKSGRVHVCKAIDGQYVIVNDKFYRDSWMLGLDKNDTTEWISASVISISEKEYDILANNIETAETVFPSEDIHEKEPESETTITVDFVRNSKLKELSDECEKIIENGFDLVLSDGVSHHFSMSLQDQMNMVDLQRALDLNEDLIYHADGELMQFYSVEDAQDILIGANKWKNYNIALFNSLKNWINNLTDIEQIDAIAYDSEIPDEYCTNVLQVLTENF